MTQDPFALLPAPIRAALERRGFEALTPVQEAVVSARSEDRDLRISSQTGSGKTVAIGFALADHFLAPPPHSPHELREEQTPRVDPAEVASGKPCPPRGPRNASRQDPRAGGRTADGKAHPTALVIVPTRELAAQVREEIAWLYADLDGLRVEVVTGGTSIMNERRALSRGPRLVVATPGRLLDHIRNGAIATDAIAHVVLDEADQMLDMGFRDELDAIVETLPKTRRSHLVSATFPRGVVELARRFQDDALVLEGTRLGESNADIQHIGYAIKRHESYSALVNILLMAEGERCLLFVNRRVDATDLAEKLARDGFGAAPFSGELAQAQRTRTLSSFRNGTLPILVSTEVAARGIDVPGIASVIHVDPPRAADTYTHRSGRTGRAGQRGRSILLVTPNDLNRVERMLRYAKIDLSWQPIPTPAKVNKALRKRARRKLHAMLDGHSPEESQWIYAKSLLEDRDPVQVVATLLDLTKSETVCEPMPVVGFDPTKPRSGNRGDRFDRGERPRKNDRERGRAERPDANAFTRFFVSWGEQSGATASRLLSQVCRRGGIKSHQVGAIEVAARVSFVSVANEVAEAFEAKALRPDARDPGIVIKRAEERMPGPKPGSRGRPAHRPWSRNERQGGVPRGPRG
jgi:ATP-dependent RNA helicase DeaD